MIHAPIAIDDGIGQTTLTMQNRRDIWILAALLIVFLAGSIYMNVEQEHIDDDKRPSSNIARAAGTKALYLLFEQQGVKTDKLMTPMLQIPDDVGLIVMADPFKRAITAPEVDAMQAWLDKGGTLLYFRSVSGSGADFTEAIPTIDLYPPASLSVDKKSEYARDVNSIAISGTTRLLIEKPEEVTVIIGDKNRPYAVTWKEKKGRVIMVADSVGFQNSRISSADNAVFLLNIAQKHASGKFPRVLFDEYHQGFGSDTDVNSKSIWSLIGPSFRMLTWYLVCGLVIYIIIGNRRFGTPKELEPARIRSTTEYISSMAGLYRRARAPHFAVETLKSAFLKDIARKVDAPENAETEQICKLSATRYGWDASQLFGLLQRCDRFMVTAEAQRSGNKKTIKSMEAEALELGRELDGYIKTVKTG